MIPELGRSLGEGNGNPLHYSCLENPMDRGTWQAAVHKVTKSQIWQSDLTLSLSLYLTPLIWPIGDRDPGKQIPRRPMGSQQCDPSSISCPSEFPAHNTPKHPMEASAWKSPADSHWSKFLICSKAPRSPQNDDCYSCWTLTGNALELPKERFTWRKEGLYFVYIGKQNCESVGRCGRWGTWPVSSVLNQLRDIQETLDLAGLRPTSGQQAARTGLERSWGRRERSQLTLEGTFWL